MAYLRPAPSLLRRLALLDYPLPLKMHAYLLLGLGVSLTFFPGLVVGNPLYTKACQLLGTEPEAPTPPAPTVDDLKTDIKENPKGVSRDLKKGAHEVHPAAKRNLSMVGLLALGLGLSYVGTSAFSDSPENNQLMYAAIPLRFAMSVTALAAWVMDREHRTVFQATVIAEDCVGAIWLAYVMKDWPGWSTFRW